MASVNILKFPTSSPADTSPLEKLESLGYDTSQILGVIGKTEGNGCVNDFSRTLSTLVWEPLIPSSAVTIFSGGTEGVLSPHVTFFVQEKTCTGLVAAVGRTRILQPYEIGTPVHAKEVRKTVMEILYRLGMQGPQVEHVFVKCPLLTSQKLAASFHTPITFDTYESMAYSRYASAMGVDSALEQHPEKDLDSMSHIDIGWTNLASCSAGAELEDCHILVLAKDPRNGHLRAHSDCMFDAIDATTILNLLQKIKDEQGEVVQVFAKAEASSNGMIRGSRHTMNTDSDIHSTRHARAAVGGLLAGLFGDTQIYVSGGAEGQGRPGGGSLCVIYRVQPGFRVRGA